MTKKQRLLKLESAKKAFQEDLLNEVKNRALGKKAKVRLADNELIELCKEHNVSIGVMGLLLLKSNTNYKY